MFNLYDTLPETVLVNGKEYKINASFDNVILMYEMLCDPDLDDVDKIAFGIEMFFIDVPELPAMELKEIWEREFINLFQDSVEAVQLDIKGNPMPKKKEEQERLMSLKQDAAYIYSSFMQQYKIDLFEEQGKMHWYKFKALLDGLDDNTKLKKVIEIRRAELPKGAKNQKARKEMEKAKKFYALKEGD